MLRKVVAIFDFSIEGLAILAGIVVVFLWGLITTEVIGRFLVDYSIPWALEVSELCLMVVTFLGTAWVLKKEGHVKIDLVTSHLRPRVQALVDVVASIMGIVICLFLVWYGTKVTIDLFQRGVISITALRMVIWPRFAIISLGSLLLVIQFCRRAYRNLMLWRMRGKLDQA